jgi:hypothetical protein
VIKMNWEDIVKREGDRSDNNIKLFETAMMNLKRAYNKVILDADKILRNAEKGEFSTFPVWLSNFEMFEEMVEGMKINMNRLTRMSDKEEEEAYRRMR